MANKFERAPAIDRRIKHIKESDVRVRILGVVVKKERESSSLVINDGDDNIIVLIPEDSMFEKAEVGKLLSVFGTVLPFEGGVELKAEALQDMRGLDKDLYIKLYNILSR